MSLLTRITKPVIRQTAAFDRGDPIVVELHEKYLRIRVKSKRGDALNVPYDAVLDLARKIAWRRDHA